MAKETSPLLGDNKVKTKIDDAVIDNYNDGIIFNQENFNQSLRFGSKYTRSSILKNDYEKWTMSTRQKIGTAALLIQDAINNDEKS